MFGVIITYSLLLYFRQFRQSYKKKELMTPPVVGTALFCFFCSRPTTNLQLAHSVIN